MVAHSEDIQKIDGNRMFWSPLFVFLLGTPVAALDWWRMGWKRKAVIFLGVSIVIALLQVWLRHGKPYTNIVTLRTSTFLIFLPFLVALIYNLILVLITFYDLRAFSRSGMQSKAVNWTIIFLFILSTGLVSFGIILSSDYFAKNTRYCHFPRLQDLRYDSEINARLGLRSILMNHYDSGCNVSWVLEFENNSLVDNQTPTPTDSIYYGLIGRQKGISKSFIAIDQFVELYPEPITQAMVDSRVEKRNVENPAFKIPLDWNHASFSGYTCFQNGKYKNCIVALGYEHILAWFEISQNGLSKSEFKQILIKTIENIDRRIYEYEVNAKN